MAEKINETNSQEMQEDTQGIEDVSGGYVYHAGKNDTPDAEHRWEVIDDKTGEVLGRYSTWKQAKAEADYKGSDTSLIWRKSYLNKLRDAYKQHKKYENNKQLNTNWEPPI